MSSTQGEREALARSARQSLNAVTGALQELRARMEGFRHYGDGWSWEEQEAAEEALGYALAALSTQEEAGAEHDYRPHNIGLHLSRSFTSGAWRTLVKELGERHKLDGVLVNNLNRITNLLADMEQVAISDTDAALAHQGEETDPPGASAAHSGPSAQAGENPVVGVDRLAPQVAGPEESDDDLTVAHAAGYASGYEAAKRECATPPVAGSRETAERDLAVIRSFLFNDLVPAELLRSGGADRYARELLARLRAPAPGTGSVVIVHGPDDTLWAKCDRCGAQSEPERAPGTGGEEANNEG